MAHSTGDCQAWISRAFRLPEAPTLQSRALRRSTVTLTELRYAGRNFGCTATLPREDAYLVSLQLCKCPDHDLYFNGRLRQPINFNAGMTVLFDLRLQPVADLRDPFHSLMFHLPQSALDDLSLESGAQHIDELRFKPGVGLDDPIVRHLLLSFAPAVTRPQQASDLFVEHVAGALVAHVAHVYGGIAITPFPHGLSRSQLRRAVELLTSDPGEDISLQHLAAVCGLSVRQVSRAFRKSTGLPPHQWLMRYRVDKAKSLLRDSSKTISDVALACGFADQSHFSRVFKSFCHVTPDFWRKQL
jgi:AraC-like DNA-binding protein